MFEDILKKYLTVKNVIFFVLAVLFIYFIFKISEIAIMFFACFVIACSLEPLVQKLSLKFKRSTACAITLVSAILLVCAFFVPIIIIGSHEIMKFTEEFPVYAGNIKTFIDSTHIANKAILAQLDLGSVVTSFSGATSQIFSDLMNAGKNIGSGIIYLIVSILIIYYFMVDKDKVKNGILRLFPEPLRERTGAIIDTISVRSGGYIIAQIVTMASVGVVVTIGLLLIRNEYALLLGLITSLFDIVPVVGPAVAFVICMITVCKSGPLVMLLTAIIFGSAQLIENNFVRPYVFGKFLNLHPLIIYLFLFIAAKYMGIIGVIFAPAIAATVVVLIEELYIKNLE